MLSRATGLVVSIAFANSLVFAQGFTGTISGTVKDESDSVLQGAMVTAKHVETRLARTAVTDASGSYSIPSLPVGAYEITAQNPEFKVELRRGIDLAVVQEAVVNVTLQVGNVEQLIGGWQWNGIFTKQDGFPFTALVGSNTSRTGDTSSNSDVPNWNPKFRGPVTLGTTDHWFDPQAF
jgi:hypothetical protein